MFYITENRVTPSKFMIQNLSTWSVKFQEGIGHFDNGWEISGFDVVNAGGTVVVMRCHV